MKFSEYMYICFDLEKIKIFFCELLKGFEVVVMVDEQSGFMDQINVLCSDFEIMVQLVYICYFIDMNDIFYKVENEFLDESFLII